MGPVGVAPDVFWVQGALVNWYLLRDGQDVTLIDAGYPRDVKDLFSSIARLGRWPDVQSVLAPRPE